MRCSGNWWIEVQWGLSYLVLRSSPTNCRRGLSGKCACPNDHKLMNDESNGNREGSPHYANGSTPGRAGSQSGTKEWANGSAAAGKGVQQANLANLLPFVEALGRRWQWLLIGGVALAAVALSGGLLLWKDSFTASAQLVRQTSTRATEVLGDRELDPNTYASLLRAPELVQRVAAQAAPRVSAETLAKKLNITAERNSEVLLVAVSTTNRQGAVDLANLYAREAVSFMQEMQTNAAARARVFVADQLAPVEDEIASLSQATHSIAVNRAAAVPSPLADKLQTARLELADLMARYTEQHPLVREQQAKIASIENQVGQTSAGGSTAGISNAASSGTIRQASDPLFMQTKLHSLESARLKLLGEKQAALSLESQPPGTCRLLAAATLEEVIPHKRITKVAVLTLFGGMLGFLLAGVLILLAEALDPRLKTAADVQRVTRLPVVASAGNLARMTEDEQRNWAFRSWTSLQHLLSPSPNHGFVCGITSSENGEGRSTWIRLMADAASQRGFRVLTIVARPPEASGQTLISAASPVASGAGLEALVPPTGSNGALVTSRALSTPDEVTQKLIGPNPEPVVEILLPGWVWNLERRKQWHTALHDWSQIDNIALLVELPPASMPETVLLAANLPNLIWLADGEKATAAKTREQLETLRHARCHLAGAVLNRVPASFFTNRLARWLGCAVLLCGLPALPAYGQENEVQSTNATVNGGNTNLSLSVVTATPRAEWQQRLTLGAGDVVTIALWGEPTLTRTEVAIGPDGRISFLEAQDVLANGLTVDELRAKLNVELGKYRRAPQAMVTPVAFRSKKYFVLGHVMTKGVYVLDRPITVLEAVARAHGFETGLVERNIITVADFSRSFLMRQGKRIPLNFERLFQSGDLSQNLSIEPGDYLYFPGSNVKEVYVVGEVRLPGATPYTPEMTLMAAIAARAGYTERAYKGKVLVVRGSLNKPEVFVIETNDILEGKATDFRLQPKDIIFVNSRPFIYAEELADLAITAFLQSIVTSATGNYLVIPYQQ